ncbi:probable G-protein coupled receptor 139 [Stegostoma tigrinum]|uniref:probable G-protein coupled receptor 139 n=1 Tax=Stegostoma tigrinum TaxID=3053191 RepID=UPI00286FEA3F|nr:probable G-protein coupled receptor 139 [Stegostoma tigrinum]
MGLSDALAWYQNVLRIRFIFRDVERIYFPLLAAVSVPLNVITIVILSRGKCGLSRCVTGYLLAMASADLLVVIFDVIWRHIPILFREDFLFLQDVEVCNIHAALLFASTDCSVWFTVAFTFDRTVAICNQKLKVKYCSEKTAATVVGTVTVLSCFKNIIWCFMYNRTYRFVNDPMFCGIEFSDPKLQLWASLELAHYAVTPCAPFALILLLNIFTVRHILVSSRARSRLQAHSKGESPRDPEMESRRRSIILLFAVSGNFIVLWAVFTVTAILQQISHLDMIFTVPDYLPDLGFMLQLLSCSTNTGIYAVTQSKFRGQFKNVVTYPICLLTKLTKQCVDGGRLLNSRP